jgi:hypothetical protein
MHIASPASIAVEVATHPSVFVCLPPNVFDPSKDYGDTKTTFYHPQTTSQGGNSYKCKFCNSIFSSQ